MPFLKGFEVLITHGLTDSKPVLGEAVLHFGQGMAQALCGNPIAAGAPVRVPDGAGATADMRSPEEAKKYLGPLGENAVQAFSSAVSESVGLCVPAPRAKLSDLTPEILANMVHNPEKQFVSLASHPVNQTAIGLGALFTLVQGPHQLPGQETASVAQGVDPQDPRAAASMAAAMTGSQRKPLFAPAKPVASASMSQAAAQAAAAALAKTNKTSGGGR